MRRVTVAALILLSLVSVAAIAIAEQTQERSAARMPQLKHIQITADSQTKVNGVIDAKGKVEVRITPIQPGEDRTVIHADEVVYHGDTGEIETRGDVRITIEKAQ